MWSQEDPDFVRGDKQAWEENKVSNHSLFQSGKKYFFLMFSLSSNLIPGRKALSVLY